MTKVYIVIVNGLYGSYVANVYSDEKAANHDAFIMFGNQEYEVEEFEVIKESME